MITLNEKKPLRKEMFEEVDFLFSDELQQKLKSHDAKDFSNEIAFVKFLFSLTAVTTMETALEQYRKFKKEEIDAVSKLLDSLLATGNYSTIKLENDVGTLLLEVNYTASYQNITLSTTGKNYTGDIEDVCTLPLYELILYFNEHHKSSIESFFNEFTNEILTINSLLKELGKSYQLFRMCVNQTNTLAELLY